MATNRATEARCYDDEKGREDLSSNASSIWNETKATFTQPEVSSWRWEVSSLLLSSLLMAAQISILFFMDGKPYYETWRPILSLNTIVATLSAFYKAAQMHAVSAAIGQSKWIYYHGKPHRLSDLETYDESSRGPLGAFEFVFKIRWGFATIGALVTILNLAIDPFTQQLVELSAKEVAVPDANVSFSYTYGYWSHVGKNIGPDAGMQVAIMNGFTNTQSTPEFKCSGVCIWDGKYTSLGVSSVCENVTKAVLATKVCSWPDEYGRNCTMRTPGGIQLDIRLGQNQTAIKLVTDIIPAEERSPDIVKVVVFRNASVYRQNYETDSEVKAEDITECTLSFVMYEDEGVSTSGSQFQISKRRTLKLGTSQYAESDGANTINRFLAINQSTHTPALYIDLNDSAYTGVFLKTLAFNIDINTAEPSILNSLGNFFRVSPMDMDIPSFSDTLAGSMTNYIRSIPGPYAHRALGSRIDTIVFVQVRWEWLALPLSVEIMAVIFTLGVIRRNQIHRLPLWKSSALALVSHRLDPIMNALATEYGGPKDVEIKARNTTVRLAAAQIT